MRYYVYNQVPAIHFNREILEQVNQLNAEIDMDLYVLPELNELIDTQQIQDEQIKAISNTYTAS